MHDMRKPFLRDVVLGIELRTFWTGFWVLSLPGASREGEFKKM
jgi:hypothetical protein